MSTTTVGAVSRATFLALLLSLTSACSLLDELRGEGDDDDGDEQQPVAVAPVEPQLAAPQDQGSPPGNDGAGSGDTGNTQGIPVPGMPGVNLPNPFPQGNANTDGGTGSGNTQGIAIPGVPGLTIPFPTGGNSSGSGDDGTGSASGDPQPPARGTLSPAPFGSFDQEGLMTSDFIRNRTKGLHATLISALGERERNMMSGVPFEIVNDPREPNAAAICTKSARRPFLLITTAMLVVAAGIAETKSYDEISGTSYFDSYIDAVVRQVQSQRPVGAVPRGLLTGPNASDPHKLSRQVHLFDQQVAFIVGHELAHHYRGHTGCVSTGASSSGADLSAEELSRILSNTAPIFHQPQEVESDMWGIVNLLEAGHNRQGGRWSEEGALFNMSFFARMRRRGGEEIFRSFFSTHPLPQLRSPIIRQTARQWSPGWRPTTTPGADGNDFHLPTPIGNIPIPIPLPQPGNSSGGQ